MSFRGFQADRSERSALADTGTQLFSHPAPHTALEPLSAPDNRFAWADLVTDGHVLAARMRRIAPWLIGLGIALIIASITQPATGLSSPWAWKTATFSPLIEERRVSYMQPVIDRLQATPTQEFTYQQVQDLAPVEEIPAAVQVILNSLKSGGGIPAHKLYLKEIPSSSFWSWEWTPEEQSNDTNVEAPKANTDGKFPDYMYVAKGSGDTYSLGAFARQNLEVNGATTGARAVRWVGVIRKFPDGWKLVSLNWSDFYLTPENPSATVLEIPSSLRLALNLPESK